MEEVKKLYRIIKLISNEKRFKILYKILNEELTIKEISEIIKLNYDKTKTYVSLLEKENLVSKRKEGRLVYVKSNVKFRENGIEFLKETQ